MISCSSEAKRSEAKLWFQKCPPNPTKDDLELHWRTTSEPFNGLLTIPKKYFSADFLSIVSISRGRASN